MHCKIRITGYVAALLFLLTVPVFAATIADNYWGGTPTGGFGPLDVLGETEFYDVNSMNVNFSGSKMSVDIYGNYFTQIASSEVTDNRTIPGDLFIGTGGWKPSGTAESHYKEDTASTTGTDWNYVVHINERRTLPPYGEVPPANETGGSVSVYAVSKPAVQYSGLNGMPSSQFAYRQDQYSWYLPPDGATAIASGQWSILQGPGDLYAHLNMVFDFADLLRLKDLWAFHWTMSCGNDAIEGEVGVPTPEPSTILLLGGGIIAVGLLLQRRRGT